MRYHRQRLWNSGAVNSRVIASRREPARRTACSVSAVQQRAERGLGQVGGVAAALRGGHAAGNAIGPVDAAHHRLRRGPVAGPVAPAIRLRRVPERLAEAADHARQVHVGSFLRRQVERAQAGHDVVLRVAQFGAGLPDGIERDQRCGRGAEIASGVAQGGLDMAHRVGRRIVGDEMARQLGGEEAVGGRVVGEEMQHRDAAGFAGREAVAHDDLFARLMREGAEAEPGRVGAQVDRPAGQHLGEVGNVGLGVAGGGADGVQFHAFAGEVLVQAAMAALAGGAVGADRLGVVQVDQHGGVVHHRHQHGLERGR